MKLKNSFEKRQESDGLTTKDIMILRDYVNWLITVKHSMPNGESRPYHLSEKTPMSPILFKNYLRNNHVFEETEYKEYLLYFYMSLVRELEQRNIAMMQYIVNNVVKSVTIYDIAEMIRNTKPIKVPGRKKRPVSILDFIKGDF